MAKKNRCKILSLQDFYIQSFIKTASRPVSLRPTIDVYEGPHIFYSPDPLLNHKKAPNSIEVSRGFSAISVYSLPSCTAIQWLAQTFRECLSHSTNCGVADDANGQPWRPSASTLKNRGWYAILFLLVYLCNWLCEYSGLHFTIPLDVSEAILLSLRKTQDAEK